MALYFYGSTVSVGSWNCCVLGWGGQEAWCGRSLVRAHYSCLGSCCHSLQGHSDDHMQVMTGKQLPAHVWVFVCLCSWPLLLPSTRWLCTKVAPGLRVSIAVSGAPYLGDTDPPVPKIPARSNCLSFIHTHTTHVHTFLSHSLTNSHTLSPYCFANCHVGILILTLDYL